jgi:hypothetical protein
VVAEGSDNSLVYYHATPNDPFSADTIAGSGTTLSAPVIAVGKANPAGEANVVAWGPGLSLLYYHAAPSNPFFDDTIAAF